MQRWANVVLYNVSFWICLLQGKHDEIEADFLKEKEALEAKYQKLYQPLYTKVSWWFCNVETCIWCLSYLSLCCIIWLHNLLLMEYQTWWFFSFCYSIWAYLMFFKSGLKFLILICIGLFDFLINSFVTELIINGCSAMKL